MAGYGLRIFYIVSNPDVFENHSVRQLFLVFFGRITQGFAQLLLARQGSCNGNGNVVQIGAGRRDAQS